MVHHDDALGRLTDGSGPLLALNANELKRIPFRATTDCMMTLGELCDLVAARVTLVLEVKSRFDGDERLLTRITQVLAAYKGPVAAMSFDPYVVAALRRTAPGLRRGIVAERRFDHAEWQAMSGWHRRGMAHLLHAPATRPDFVAYRVDDLPAPATRLARLFDTLVLTWTVRNDAQRECAARWADQMIFEGFRP